MLLGVLWINQRLSKGKEVLVAIKSRKVQHGSYIMRNENGSISHKVFGRRRGVEKIRISGPKILQIWFLGMCRLWCSEQANNSQYGYQHP